jgi:hypothetical protein
MSGVTICITQAQLEAALARWEQDSRDGDWVSEEDRLAMPVTEVANRNAPYLFNLLQQIAAPTGAAA